MEIPNTRRDLDLPQELTEEILSRLAVKSLLRFRLINMESVRIVGCCNGLVCCCIDLRRGRFLLWNPATRISMELPQLVLENRDRPSSISGFGWDESSGAYKVFVVLLSSRKFMGRVYSSNTNSWKTVEFFDIGLIHSKAHFVSGKLHWLHIKNTDERDNYEIATFDLKKEEFGVMKLPRGAKSVRLGVNEGRLTMILEKKRTYFDVWVMKQDCWVKVRDGVVYEPCEVLPSVAPFCAVDEAEIRQVRGSNFKLYDQARDDVHSQMKKIRDSLQTHLYIESLVSPVPDKNLCRAI
ncbi:F-box protein At3g07870-like [Salvia miltiorrhiza]|uniref:F-box protein At3g07870-like n=1 Tax=Salvia miltiorrhiza TaxID=226208 RepID=UPI0025AC771B|nr:F-box protein At3g07870-like [Salvia miltiorrhiza]